MSTKPQEANLREMKSLIENLVAILESHLFHLSRKADGAEVIVRVLFSFLIQKSNEMKIVH